MKRRHDIGSIIDGQRGLGDEGKFIRITRGDCCDVFGGFDQQDFALGQLTHRANCFRVTRVADHDHLQAVVGVALRFDVDLGHQRAGGVDIDHFARLGRGGNSFRHAMCRENHRAVIGTFVQLFDKDSALIAQAVDDKFVVHNFVANIDRRPPFGEGHLNNLDRAINTGAKPARGGHIEGEGWLGHRLSPSL